jgi:hypothetical protein
MQPQIDGIMMTTAECNDRAIGLTSPIVLSLSASALSSSFTRCQAPSRAGQPTHNVVCSMLMVINKLPPSFSRFYRLAG